MISSSQPNGPLEQCGRQVCLLYAACFCLLYGIPRDHEVHKPGGRDFKIVEACFGEFPQPAFLKAFHASSPISISQICHVVFFVSFCYIDFFLFSHVCLKYCLSFFLSVFIYIYIFIYFIYVFLYRMLTILFSMLDRVKLV